MEEHELHVQGQAAVLGESRRHEEVGMEKNPNLCTQLHIPQDPSHKETGLGALCHLFSPQRGSTVF